MLNIPMRAAVRCDIHHWHCDQSVSIQDGLCPYGRMEAQLDAALGEIERRLTDLENARVSSVQS